MPEEATYVASARFQPWIGAQYLTTGWDGLRLLVVGDSFWEKPGDNLAQNPRLTADVVRWAMEKPCKDFMFYANVEHGILGRPLNDRAEREEFWSRIAFINYFQRVMGASNEPPTAQDRRDAIPVFINILDVLSPHAVLVASTRVWGAMGKLPGLTSTPFQPDPPFEVREWHWESRPSVLATWTYHPSYWGAKADRRFTGPATQGRIQRFLALAQSTTAGRHC